MWFRELQRRNDLENIGLDYSAWVQRPALNETEF